MFSKLRLKWEISSYDGWINSGKYKNMSVCFLEPSAFPKDREALGRIGFLVKNIGSSKSKKWKINKSGKLTHE